MSDSIKERLSSLVSAATTFGQSVVETVKDKADRGKEVVEEHMREREAREIYRKLGKKIYKLVGREELSLPVSCHKYIDALDELFDLEADESDDDDDKSGDSDVVDAVAADEIKEGCKDCGKKDEKKEHDVKSDKKSGKKEKKMQHKASEMAHKAADVVEAVEDVIIDAVEKKD